MVASKQIDDAACRKAFEEHFAGMDLKREILGNQEAPFYYYAETQEKWEDWMACWNKAIFG